MILQDLQIAAIIMSVSLVGTMYKKIVAAVELAIHHENIYQVFLVICCWRAGLAASTEPS